MPRMSGRARGLRTLGTFYFLTLVGGACCPDEPTEVCHTLDEWKKTPGCVAFPETSQGVCPDAEAVTNSCHAKMSQGRMKGNQCCYDMRGSCE
jgi:hypothetical protein